MGQTDMGLRMCLRETAALPVPDTSMEPSNQTIPNCRTIYKITASAHQPDSSNPCCAKDDKESQKQSTFVGLKEMR